MKINRNNYEEFFLDYYEHSLDAGQVAELMVFLEANPDLNEEFEAFEALPLVPERTFFERKEKLKKKEYEDSGDITALNYEAYMVAGMEKDLDDDGRRQLEAFLTRNPEARLEYDLFLKTKLQPGLFTYPGKAGLRKSMVRIYHRRVAAVAALAASLLILWGIWWQQEGETLQPVRNDAQIARRIEALPAPGTVSAGPGVVPVEYRNHRTFDHQVVTVARRPEDGTTAQVLPLRPLRMEAPVHQAIAMEPADGLSYISERRIYRGSPEASLLAAADGEQQPFAIRFIKGAFGKVFQERQRSGKTFIEYTVSGYNLMADREVEVEKQYDPSGRVIAYRVNGELIKLGRQVNPPLGE